ncbi:Gfo/Idh/MocA family protein [Shimia abyssi]|uniref:Oxidoreductase family protein n=1 Tax=Shimia abyssi TaxID=1662395 RepID=A0A2P8FAZ5_9RHOB|nr:Gfo/Idh/MocA family oxidoreductase [Shimia abyssi]PSL18906.1 oxidoreductase family protein [Shimia abyssi]
MRRLRVLVAGTGFAGRGHTQAFRAAGAEVVGMVGRNEHVARDITARLGIPFSGTNWAEALSKLKPDVVSIATPGGAHFEQVSQAIAAGCHVFCDKPLAIDGCSASRLREMAEERGIKTAYAASFQYTPSVQHAKRLIAQGAIGSPTEVESISHFHLERGIPFGWSHRAEDGGGRLNNNFTHSLAIAETLIQGGAIQICGDVRDDMGKAPIVEGVHDFTTRRDFIPEDLNDPSLDWGESNVEWSYTVMARMQSKLALKPVSVLFKHGGLVPRFHDDHIAVYGTEGAIFLKGHYGSGALFLHDGVAWEMKPVPADLASSVPPELGETEQCWHVITNLFTRDICGEAVPGYPTFAQGCRFQNIIDVIRRSDTWVDIERP